MLKPNKTTKLIRGMITHYETYVKWTENIIHSSKLDPPATKESPDLLIAQVQGMYLMIEHAMRESKCYAGYQYVGSTAPDGAVPVGYADRTVVGSGDTQYREWRRRYYCM